MRRGDARSYFAPWSVPNEHDKDDPASTSDPVSISSHLVYGDEVNKFVTQTSPGLLNRGYGYRASRYKISSRILRFPENRKGSGLHLFLFISAIRPSGMVCRIFTDASTPQDGLLPDKMSHDVRAVATLCRWMEMAVPVPATPRRVDQWASK